MSRLRYAAVWLLDRLDHLSGHRCHRLCQWLAWHPWWDAPAPSRLEETR